MSNGSPPTRRRPAVASAPGGTGQRPAVRGRTSSGVVAARPAPLPISGTKLVVMEGPRSGEEIALEEGEYVIGRSTDNPICIPDTSVSRRHVMIRQLGSGWVVSDLGSGNGTLVNGEPISDETPLAHGDLLRLGDSELMFQDTSNATVMMAMPTEPPARPARARTGAVPALPSGDEEEAPAAGVPRRPPPRPEGRVRTSRGRAALPTAQDPAAQKRKRRLLLLTAAVFVMLVGLLAVMKAEQQKEAELAAAKAQAAQQRRAELDGLFQEAKNLVRDGKWSDAKAKLLELQAQEPNYLQLADYLARVEKEIPNQEALEGAKLALDKGQLAEAATLLGKVQDTQLFDTLRTLRTTLTQKADERVREAQALLDQKKLDEAKAITDDVLAAIPEHRDATVIGEQAARAIEIRDRPPPPPPSRPTPKPWHQAEDRFQAGDLQGAVAMANACAGRHSRCKSLLGQMTEFGNLYKKMESLDARGLSRLLDLDRRITSGRGSTMARKAGTRAANIFYKSASAAKASGQWGRAMDYAQRALQAEPGHTGANAIATELRQKAKDLYMQAYALKDTNPDDAVPKFREVLAMTTPDDETHQKAKSWIEKLSR